MATNDEKTVKRGLFDFAAGTLTTLGVGAAAKAIQGHIGSVAEDKAKEMFVDLGDRAKVLAETAKLIASDDKDKRDAGWNVHAWILQAWSKNDEGELTNLLKKVADADKPVVFLMLGKLGSYEEFTTTIRAFLAHDNLLQAALKIVKQAESTGETIIGDDTRKRWKETTTSINNIAGAARPSVRNLTEMLRRIK